MSGTKPVMLLMLTLHALPLLAQDAPPPNLEAVETARSRTCVDVLTRLEDLDSELAPLAFRAEWLLAIGGAIMLEESAIVDSLDTADPLEADVAAWFRDDAELAERYLTEQSQDVLDQRSSARRAIQQRVADALAEVEARADSIVAPTGDLRQQAVSCSGAILVRPTAIEACEGVTSRVCEAARDSASAEPFRFEESAEYLWYREELRPWTAPGPLQATPDGQLNGARTLGYTRVGNLVVNLAFNPIFQPRADLSPTALETFQSIDAALGIDITHPDIVFAPGLGVQVTLPQPLAEETGYLLHFGPPDTPDILWKADVAPDAPLATVLALDPDHVAKLAAGEPLTLSAIRATATDPDDLEIVYAIELTNLNQASRVTALLGYMIGQLSSDLTRLFPPTANP
jgi:hypothetical protein